ncbi:hypothetical protein STEG23_005290 [Scotinomys teguina]
MAPQLGPHELVHVFSFLEARDLLCAAQVNKVWNEVSMTKELWRQLCLRRWASCKAFPVVVGTQTWKEYYFCRSELEFRVESGRPRDFICKSLSGHTGKIDQLAYVTPHEYRFDEKAKSVVCTVSSDCTVRAWDLHEGTEIWSSPVQPAPLVSLVTYPLLQLVVTVDTRGLIIGWKVETGSEWASFCLPTFCSSMEACGHAEGPFLMVACAEGNLYTLTVPRLQVVSKVATFSHTSVNLTCSPDQQWVFVFAQGSDLGPKVFYTQSLLYPSEDGLPVSTSLPVRLSSRACWAPEEAARLMVMHRDVRGKHLVITTFNLKASKSRDRVSIVEQQLASFSLPDTVTPHLMQGHGSQVILLASRSELVLFTIHGLQLVAFQDHQRPITSMWVTLLSHHCLNIATQQIKILAHAPLVDTLKPHQNHGTALATFRVTADTAAAATLQKTKVTRSVLSPGFRPLQTCRLHHEVCKVDKEKTEAETELKGDRSPVNSVPPTKGANVETNPPENYLPKPGSVYGNFRRWQYIKTLVQRHLSQTPDVAAFSCFLIPVFRSLARRKPTMNVEEGLWRGLQEWRSTSNYDRMIFFEMAEKFAEFESAEEMENSRREMMRGVQCQVLATTTMQDPPRPPAPEVVEEPVCNSMKAAPKTDHAHLPVLKHQQLQKTEAPMEIPPEAVQEYMNIMDWLERLPQSVTGEPREEEEENIGPKQEEDDLYSDAGLLDYIDQLCSQKHFVEQVETIINPQFVAEILSSKPEMDMLALMKELEYEEEFKVQQLLEKHLALKTKGCKMAPLNPGAPQIRANASVLTDCQDAKKDDHGPQRGTSAQKCPGTINAEIWGPRSTVLPSSLPSLVDIGSTVIPCGRETAPQNPGSKWAVSRGGFSATEEPYESPDRTIEDKEELPSLSFLLYSQYRLVPWKLASHSCPYAGFSDSDSIPSPSSPKIRSLGPDASSTAKSKSKKQALIGGLTSMAKRSNSGPGHGMFEGPFSALELAHPLQAQKRKYESLGTRKRKRKKRH